jgi:hypothetical protein
MRFNTSRFAPPRIPCVASKPARLHFFVLDQFARFFKPVATKVRLAGNPVAIYLTKPLDVPVAQFATHEFVAKKRRIADEHIALRP